jgi:hypothetical protein
MIVTGKPHNVGDPVVAATGRRAIIYIRIFSPRP